HVGSLLVFEGPAPSYTDFCEHFATCLDPVPRYRQRVQRMPFDLARPIWVDDPHFALGYHLRHTALPAPGSDEQLRTLVGRIMSQRLDIDRPLWELWMVEGLTDNRWALITKTHHAMIDGLAGGELMEIVLDRDPDRRRLPPADWQPRPGPSRLGLVSSGAAWAAQIPLSLASAARSAARALASPSDVLRFGAVRASGLAEVSRSAVSPTSVLNGPLGPHRRWGWARAELADVKAVKDAAGCTVNDVVLAAIAGAFRQYLIARGDDVDDVVLRSLVPVSIRADHHRGRLGNHVTAMFAQLPIGIADPVQRLAAVARQMDHLKASGMAVGVESMVAAADFVPATLMTLGARVYARMGQRVVNTVTTNIPGPQYPLYLRGHRMIEMFPYIPIARDVRISIGIVSYDGHLTIGATGDYDAVADLDELCAAIDSSLDELVSLLVA
ncbi:MAG: wax ester/triacylglycerol synthase family O-acyltransferase, partial [bacterium]|nr:wax ester/triacylglycerol synthase family O-acyltransferase [bacterium]